MSDESASAGGEDWRIPGGRVRFMLLETFSIMAIPVTLAVLWLAEQSVSDTGVTPFLEAFHKL